MERNEIEKKMKDLKSRAKKARQEGNRDVAMAFRAGMRRLERRLRGMPKPAEAPRSEA